MVCAGSPKAPEVTNRKRHSKTFITFLSNLTSSQIWIIPLVDDATPPTQRKKKPCAEEEMRGRNEAAKGASLLFCGYVRGRCSCSVTGEWRSW